MSISSDFITVRDLAKELGIHEQTLYSRIRAGHLPVTRVSARCILVRKSDVERMLQDMAR